MLNGSLIETSLPEVLRLLSASSQTGCLVLNQSGPVAFFYFKIGQLSHCECVIQAPQGPFRIKGLDAVAKSCLYNESSFAFDSHSMSEDETLLKYPTAKLIDSIALFIEKRKTQSIALPAPTSILAHQGGHPLRNFKANQEELGLLLLANGKRNLVEIAALAHQSLPDIQEWAARFLANGLLAQASPEAPTPAASPARPAEERKTVRFWRGKPVEE